MCVPAFYLVSKNQPTISRSTLDVARRSKRRTSFSWLCSFHTRGTCFKQLHKLAQDPCAHLSCTHMVTKEDKEGYDWCSMDLNGIPFLEMLKSWNAGSVRTMSWFWLKAHHSYLHKRRANQRSVLEHACSCTTVSLNRLMRILIVCLLCSPWYQLCRNDHWQAVHSETLTGYLCGHQ